MRNHRIITSICVELGKLLTSLNVSSKDASTIKQWASTKGIVVSIDAKQEGEGSNSTDSVRLMIVTESNISKLKSYLDSKLGADTSKLIIDAIREYDITSVSNHCSGAIGDSTICYAINNRASLIATETLCQEAQDALLGADSKNKELLTLVDTLNKSVLDLESSNKTNSQYISELEPQSKGYGILFDKLEEAKRELSELKAIIDKNNKYTGDLEGEVKEKESKIESLGFELSETKILLKRTASSLVAVEKESESFVNDQGGIISALNGENSNLKKKIKTIEEEISELSDIKDKCLENKLKAEEYEKELKSLKAIQEKASKEIAEYKETQQENLITIDDLSKEAVKLDKSLNDSVKTNTELQAQVKVLNTQVEKGNDDALVARINLTNQELNSSREENSVLLKENRNLTLEVSKLSFFKEAHKLIEMYGVFKGGVAILLSPLLFLLSVITTFFKDLMAWIGVTAQSKGTNIVAIMVAVACAMATIDAMSLLWTDSSGLYAVTLIVAFLPIAIAVSSVFANIKRLGNESMENLLIIAAILECVCVFFCYSIQVPESGLSFATDLETAATAKYLMKTALGTAMPIFNYWVLVFFINVNQGK